MRNLAGGFLLTALPALLVAGCSTESGSSAASTPAASSTVAVREGPVVDLHIECAGDGSPTIVLIAGLNTSGEVFTGIADQLAPITRTCWYDRAGIGSSPPLGSDPTPSSAAIDLDASLTEQGIAPPYVVLGWSYGGLVAQAFASEYPDQLAGLVLEDTSVREQFTDPELMSLDEEIGVHWAEGGREIDAAELVAELADLDFHDLPLAVLSQDARGAWGRIWLGYHDELARLSTDGIHAVGTGSGHVMHEDVPDLVVRTVQTVLAAVGTGSLKGACNAQLADVGGRCRPL